MNTCRKKTGIEETPVSFVYCFFIWVNIVAPAPIHAVMIPIIAAITVGLSKIPLAVVCVG